MLSVLISSTSSHGFKDHITENITYFIDIDYSSYEPCKNIYANSIFILFIEKNHLMNLLPNVENVLYVQTRGTDNAIIDTTAHLNT